MSKIQGQPYNEAKKILANEVTKLCHGVEAALAAAETARETFEGAGIGADLPTVEILENDLQAGVLAFDIFRQAGLTNTNGEARRLIKGNGARLNDQIIDDETRLVSLDDVNQDGVIKLSAGKKQHVLIRPQG